MLCHCATLLVAWRVDEETALCCGSMPAVAIIALSSRAINSLDGQAWGGRCGCVCTGWVPCSLTVQPLCYVRMLACLPSTAVASFNQPTLWTPGVRQGGQAQAKGTADGKSCWKAIPTGWQGGDQARPEADSQPS